MRTLLVLLGLLVVAAQAGPTLDVDKTTGPIPLVVIATAKLHEPHSTYTWRFGDGTEDISQVGRDTVSHTYQVPGTYTLSLMIERTPEETKPGEPAVKDSVAITATEAPK